MVKEESERLGYKIVYKVINAANYGVPQIRQRFICVGVKKDLKDFVFPEETHSENGENGKKKWVTCGDVIGDIDYDLPEDKERLAGSKHKHLLPLVPPGDNYLFFTEKEDIRNLFSSGVRDIGHSCSNYPHKSHLGLYKQVFQITWDLFIGKIVF